jgi:hypothetical protein
MIGWYLHHHGQGHLQRLRAIAPHLSLPLVVFSSLPRPAAGRAPELAEAEWILLPDDWSPEPGLLHPAEATPNAGGALHWAPQRHRGYGRRMARIAAEAHRLSGMVVDVSAEVVALSRLLGLPTVAVTQPGERTDAPHRLAYDLADAILAPFPDLPGGWTVAGGYREKTTFTGGISLRADDTAKSPDAESERPVGVAVIGSRGGSVVTEERARALADAEIRLPDGRPVEWRFAGVPGFPWLDDVGDVISQADAAVLTAGLGSVADAAARGLKAVVLPQERPFAEQEHTGRMLAEMGVPVSPVWPEPEAWGTLLDRALRLDGSVWKAWRTAGAAERAAEAIHAVIEGDRPMSEGGLPQRVALVTLADAGRLERVRRQVAALSPQPGRGSALRHILVWLGDPSEAPVPPAGAGGALDGVVVLPTARTGGLPLAAARNAGASAAEEWGAELIVFLDADCIPGAEFLSLTARAASVRPDALLAGPVTYLTEEETAGSLEEILRSAHPHSARPDPQTGELLTIPAEGERTAYDLFWSLSFAATPAVFRRIGGFWEEYSGYGGEDTDFAYSAHRAGVDLVWVGGAHAFHQHHPVSSPPVEHLDEILVNARIFHRRWGVWPMTGWLEQFRDSGLVEQGPEGWTRS